MAKQKGMYAEEDETPLHLRHKTNQQVSSAGPQSGYAVGQRWMSEMESDLGLGLIEKVEFRTVTISFHDGATTRIYTKENAPLRRVIFKPGDQLQTVGGTSLTVESVTEKSGTCIYHSKAGEIHEKELSGSIRVTAPLDRLLSGFTDSCADFDLRYQVLEARKTVMGSSMRGFIGGRIELIPHQLYIAHETASRFVRRVMFADEVGLGKTIEACLVLHRLIVSGRAVQAMIIVPEPLINVWFVELLRKFNLLFKIFDREYMEQVPFKEVNPFTEESLILTSLDQFSKFPDASKAALATNWDIVIVDEAHHLRENTPSFTFINNISKVSRDLLFLTATPQQFGEQNFFARLQMLDSSRYSDYNSFLKESAEHKKIARITGKLLDGEQLSPEETLLLEKLFPESSDLIQQNSTSQADTTKRQELVAELLDRHGIGRALFRNTRSVIGGFPKREVHIHPLDGSKKCVDTIRNYYKEDLLLERNLADRKLVNDPRVDFLSELLRSKKEEKVLVICRRKETAMALEEALKKEINVNTALFHEDLTILQRDRNAAYFAEDEGARILICSEIGSEGRNFQFVHNLCMFDLPPDPELVEQRIGRLDRIGQKGPIRIIVPYVKSTPEDILTQWFHDGIGLFESTAPAAQEVFEQLGAEVKRCIEQCDTAQAALHDLLERTKALTATVTNRLKTGRDRLLEQHSFRPEQSRATVAAIGELDNSQSIKNIMESLFKARGILVEEFNRTTWKLWADSPLDDLFPGLRATRPVVTFDRRTAIQREEIEFLTIDHPAVHEGIELFLSEEKGNAVLATMTGSVDRELLMEAVYVIDCIAPKELVADRFLPPIPIRVLVDNKMRERKFSFLDQGKIESVPALTVLERLEVKKTLIPSMQKKALSFATTEAAIIIENAIAEVNRMAGGELERLKTLQQKNSAISDEEIMRATYEAKALLEAIQNASPRLDAVRLIWCQGEK